MEYPSVAVIIPSFNEANYIKIFISELKEILENSSYKWEIIVVDDGSTDNTYEQASDNFIKINRINLGKGYAVREGMRFANSDYIAIIDADLDIHPSHLLRFLEAKKDIVIGSKLHPDSKVNYSFKRKIVSLGYSNFIKLLFGLKVRDTQTGIKVFRKNVLHRIYPLLTINRFAFDVEILVALHELGYEITEMPVEINPVNKLGSVSIYAIISTFWDTLKIYWRLRNGCYTKG